MNTQPTPSELIYLYMDGELEAGQHQELFSQLSNSPELQEEFNDAMAMKSAFESERLSTIVPPSITESVMTDAGVAPVASSGTSSALIGGLGTTVMTFLRKSIVPLSLLVAGAGVMYFVMKFPDTEPTSSTQLSVNQRNNNSTPSFASDGLQEASAKSAEQSDRNITKQSESSDLASELNIIRNAKRNNLSSKSAESNNDERSTISAKNQNNNQTEASTHPVELATQYTPYKEEPVEPAVIEQPTLSYARTMPTQQSSKRYYSQPVALSFTPLVIQTTSFRLQFNRLFTMYQIDNNASPVGVADNLSMSGMYYWNNNNALGIDVGRYRFPIEAVIDNEVQINPVVTAISAVYSYRDSGTELLSGEPYIQCQVGYSSLGVPVLVQGGLGYTVGPLRINAGVETGSLLYKARDGATWQPSSPLFRLVGGLSFGL
jgi:hypothetical protein